MGHIISAAVFLRDFVLRKRRGLLRRLYLYKTKQLLKRLRAQSKTGVTENKRTALCRALRQKECISIVFTIENISKWKADSLLRLCLSHPRFKPSIHILVFNEEDTRGQELQDKLIREYAESLGVPCYRYDSYDHLPPSAEIDLVILCEPYDFFYFHRERYRGLTKHALCYIPYGFFAIGCAETMNNATNNIALFNFYENEATKRLATSLMDNGGANVRITGHTMADAFLFSQSKDIPAWKECGKPMKKVIWAPHWTIIDGESWFACGNFLEIADRMLELAEYFRNEIQFAFKPHPSLHKTLCKHPDWGKEKTDTYYRRWAEMPNTQLEEGSYAALFMQSDAIIHDCGSFIIEYMFADKPALFLVRGEGYQGYSPMAQEALNCYIKGKSSTDVENFLISLLKQEDSLSAERKSFRENYLIPPHGCSAAQNIINCLLGEGPYADKD